MAIPARTVNAPSMRTPNPTCSRIATTFSSTSRRRNRVTFGCAAASRSWSGPSASWATRAAATQSAAGVSSAQAALEAEKRAAQSLGSAKAQAVAQAAAAHAAVEAAKLDLERTVIKAPVAGVVGARSVRPGQLVQPGVALMSVVPLGQAYVVANFKETQVARIRVGQRVEAMGTEQPNSRGFPADIGSGNDILYAFERAMGVNVDDRHSLRSDVYAAIPARLGASHERRANQ